MTIASLLVFEKGSVLPETDFPACLAALSIHARSGYYPALFEEAANLLYERLVAQLSARSRFRRIDPDVISDGVVDALAEFTKRPHLWDPATLVRHLLFAAQRNVLNRLRSETRLHKREAAVAKPIDRSSSDVELSSPVGNLIMKEAANQRQSEYESLLALFAEPVDKRIAELILARERRTSLFAEVLGIGHLPIEEQRKHVKRAKDRLKKTVKRRKD